jgi:hypothetical protein
MSLRENVLHIKMFEVSGFDVKCIIPCGTLKCSSWLVKRMHKTYLVSEGYR